MLVANEGPGHPHKQHGKSPYLLNMYFDQSTAKETCSEERKQDAGTVLLLLKHRNSEENNCPQPTPSLCQVSATPLALGLCVWTWWFSSAPFERWLLSSYSLLFAFQARWWGPGLRAAKLVPGHLFEACLALTYGYMRLSTGCVARHETLCWSRKVDLDWLFQSQPLLGIFEMVACTSTCSCKLYKGMVDLKWHILRSQISPNRLEKVPKIAL